MTSTPLADQAARIEGLLVEADRQATDIPELIARLTTLRDGLGLFHDADQEAITEAIAALAAQAQAIQEWKEHCQKIHDEAHEIHGGSGKIIGDLREKIAAQAQEIERLKFDSASMFDITLADMIDITLADFQASLEAYRKDAEAAEARVRELEADQEKRIERARKYMNRIAELEAELAAKEATP